MRFWENTPDGWHCVDQCIHTLVTSHLTHKTDHQLPPQSQVPLGLLCRDLCKGLQVHTDPNSGYPFWRSSPRDHILGFEFGVRDVVRSLPNGLVDHRSVVTPSIFRVYPAVEHTRPPCRPSTFLSGKHMEKGKRRCCNHVSRVFPDRLFQARNDRAAGKQSHELVHWKSQPVYRSLQVTEKPA